MYKRVRKTWLASMLRDVVLLLLLLLLLLPQVFDGPAPETINGRMAMLGE
jgi:hypothetical protein